MAAALRRTGATLRWFPVTDEGRLDESALDDLVNERTKLVSIVQVSNILGTVNDPARIVAGRTRSARWSCSTARSRCRTCRSTSQALDADFLAFTGHKMLGPTGIGVLWGRAELLEAMPPLLGGGSMIETVTIEKSTFAPAPARFEAGTPPIVEAIGLGAAIDYLNDVGMAAVQAHEQEITAYALEVLSSVPTLRIFGPTTPEGRGGTISFALEGIHPHDVGQVLDDEGVEVRVGHHCARPVCVRYGVPATTRASFYVYTTTEEVDALVRGLERVRKVFG